MKRHIRQSRRFRLLSGMCDSRGADITSMNLDGNIFLTSDLCKSNGKIAAAGCDIKDGCGDAGRRLLRDLLQNIPDGRIGAAPPIDAPQSNQCLMVRRLVQCRIVHQLRLEVSSTQVKSHRATSTLRIESLLQVIIAELQNRRQPCGRQTSADLGMHNCR